MVWVFACVDILDHLKAYKWDVLIKIVLKPWLQKNDETNWLKQILGLQLEFKVVNYLVLIIDDNTFKW